MTLVLMKPAMLVPPPARTIPCQAKIMKLAMLNEPVTIKTPRPLWLAPAERLPL